MVGSITHSGITTAGSTGDVFFTTDNAAGPNAMRVGKYLVTGSIEKPDGTLVQIGPLGPLAGTGAFRLVDGFTFDQPGVYTVTVTADSAAGGNPFGMIPESNELNNVRAVSSSGP